VFAFFCVGPARGLSASGRPGPPMVDRPDLDADWRGKLVSIATAYMFSITASTFSKGEEAGCEADAWRAGIRTVADAGHDGKVNIC